MLRILPFTRLPMVNFFSISSQGFASSWRRPNEIFCSSLFTEHYCFHFLADAEDIGGAHDPFRPRKLGDMDESFYAFLDFNKRSVGNKVGDFALDPLTSRETLLDLVPRILLGLFKSERHALFFLVDVEHDDFQLLSDL